MRHAIVQSMPVLAMLAALSQQVMAAPVAEARVELTNLRYQLTDLNPNDGIAPNLVFTGPSYPGQLSTVLLVSNITSNGNETLSGALQRLDLTGLPFSPQNTGSLSVGGVNASATKTIDGQSAHSAIDAQNVNNLLALYPNNLLTYYSQGASTSGISDAAFTLSPGTKVEFFVDVDMATTLDAAAIQPLTNGLFSGTGNLRVGTQASINGGIRFLDLSDFDTFYNYRGQSYTFSNAGVQLNSEVNQVSDFHLVLTNASNATKTGELRLTVGAAQGLALTGPVPEPGTLALQALGLLGVAGVVSRHRRR